MRRGAIPPQASRNAAGALGKPPSASLGLTRKAHSRCPLNRGKTKEISIFVVDKDGSVVERGVSIGPKIGQRRWDMETYAKAAEKRFTSRINRDPVDGSVLLECRLPVELQRTWRLSHLVAGSGDRPTQYLLS